MNEITNKDEFIFGLKGKKKGGTLDRWINSQFDNYYMLGKIKNSPANMFVDGDVVRTSKIIEIHQKDGKDYILETKHSYYYLGDKGTEADLENYYKIIYKDKDNWM